MNFLMALLRTLGTLETLSILINFRKLLRKDPGGAGAPPGGPREPRETVQNNGSNVSKSGKVGKLCEKVTMYFSYK